MTKANKKFRIYAVGYLFDKNSERVAHRNISPSVEITMLDRTHPSQATATGNQSHRVCFRALVRLESHCYREKISWIKAKTSIMLDAVRVYLANPRYLLLPTTA